MKAHTPPGHSIADHRIAHTGPGSAVPRRAHNVPASRCEWRTAHTIKRIYAGPKITVDSGARNGAYPS